MTQKRLALTALCIGLIVVAFSTLVGLMGLVGADTEATEHRFRMTLVVLNDELDLMPVAQTEFDVEEGETTPDVLFSRDGKLVFCSITAGHGVGDVKAQCIDGTEPFGSGK